MDKTHPFYPSGCTRTRAGHWADRPAVDTRVSRVEQDDQMPVVGAPDTWLVVLLCLSPILTIGFVSLVALLSR
jgi:hypothetical protein